MHLSEALFHHPARVFPVSFLPPFDANGRNHRRDTFPFRVLPFFFTFPSPLFACFACIRHWGDDHHDDAVYHYKDESVWMSDDVRDHLCLCAPLAVEMKHGLRRSWWMPTLRSFSLRFPFSIRSPFLSSVHHDGRALRLRLVFLSTLILQSCTGEARRECDAREGTEGRDARAFKGSSLVFALFLSALLQFFFCLPSRYFL